MYQETQEPRGGSGNWTPHERSAFHAALARACGISDAAWASLVREAERLGAHPLDLALGDGLMEEARFLAALARLIGGRVAAEPPPPLDKPRAEEAFAFRSYTSAEGRVIAPHGALADLLMRMAREKRGGGVLLTPRQALLDALLADDGARLAHKAAHDLPEGYSARRWAPGLARANRFLPLLAGGVLLLVIALGLLAPAASLIVPPLVLAPLFIVAGLAVLTATFESTMPPRATLPGERAALPRYSVLVPLHREANIVPALIERLSALLYPRDRLEIFFLVEQDDAATAAALLAAKLPASMLVMRLPDGAPRTKPRAMNLALPFCSGALVVAYDAEDAPEPDQLLRAAALFRVLPERVACLQGRLAIANHRDGFLTRRFAVDYAALFDCIKAGMGRAGWPVPLGGTSNHFRTALLRRVGAWDAWNVTEDADLGIRLARFGYIVEDLPSTTWEEAPNTFSAWMNQRTRWMKGWMQTLLVHFALPRRGLSELGLFRFLMIGSIGVSVILGALLYPLFMAGVVARLISPVPLGGGPGLLSVADAMLVFAITIGALVEIVPAALALRRRGALRLLLMTPLAPITHLMVSMAAWRALRDLLKRPWFWHKTDHGLARTSQGLGALRSTRKTPPA